MILGGMSVKIFLKTHQKPEKFIVFGRNKLFDCSTDPGTDPRIWIQGYKDTQIHIRTRIYVYPYP
jgi:hypothetical protein